MGNPVDELRELRERMKELTKTPKYKQLKEEEKLKKKNVEALHRKTLDALHAESHTIFEDLTKLNKAHKEKTEPLRARRKAIRAEIAKIYGVDEGDIEMKDVE